MNMNKEEIKEYIEEGKELLYENRKIILGGIGVLSGLYVVKTVKDTVEDYIYKPLFKEENKPDRRQENKEDLRKPDRNNKSIKEVESKKKRR